MRYPLIDTPLRRILIERKLSARQLAKDIDASHSAVACLVNGKVRKHPNPLLVQAIAEHLGISPDEVIAS